MQDTFYYLLMIEQYGSMLEASRHGHISQSAITNKIKKLETSLGVTIFRRHCEQNRIAFTEEGLTVLSFARRFLSLETEMRESLHGISSADRLTIGVGRTVGTYIAPYLIESFKRSFPDIECTVKMEPALVLLKKLEERQIDLMVSSLSSPSRKKFSVIPFYNDSIRLVASTTYPIPDKITSQELKKYPVILREPGSVSNTNLEKALNKAKISRSELKAYTEMFSNEAVKQAIKAGNGIGFLPECAIQDYEKKELKIIPIRSFTVDYPLYITTVKNTSQNPAIQQFLDLALSSDWRFPTQNTSSEIEENTVYLTPQK